MRPHLSHSVQDSDTAFLHCEYTVMLEQVLIMEEQSESLSN